MEKCVSVAAGTTLVLIARSWAFGGSAVGARVGSHLRPAGPTGMHLRYLGAAGPTGMHLRYLGAAGPTGMHLRYLGAAGPTGMHLRYVGAAGPTGMHLRYLLGCCGTNRDAPQGSVASWVQQRLGNWLCLHGRVRGLVPAESEWQPISTIGHHCRATHIFKGWG
jgi:hypothetical protein